VGLGSTLYGCYFPRSNFNVGVRVHRRELTITWLILSEHVVNLNLILNAIRLSRNYLLSASRNRICQPWMWHKRNRRCLCRHSENFHSFSVFGDDYCNCEKFLLHFLVCTLLFIHLVRILHELSRLPNVLWLWMLNCELRDEAGINCIIWRG
jgi:hypothetical protein